MRRQSSKTQLVVSGIFCAALLAALAAVFFHANLSGVPPKQPSTALVNNVLPLPGHWLMTAQENWYIPARAEKYQSKTAVQQDMKSPKVMPVYSLESARTSLNRGLDSLNVLYVWSDADQLKVISITSFNLATRKAAIVVIPLSTVVNAGETPTSQEKWSTVQDVYREQGREGIKALLEEKFEISIPSYVHVNQAALQQLSEIVGVLTVNGDEINMLDAFEQTASGIRRDDRDVVRAVTSRILRPQMLAEVPRLLWIFTHEVKTNLSAEEMIKMFNLSRQMDLSNMQKTALPGYEYVTDDSKLVLVSDQTWKNIIYEITN